MEIKKLPLVLVSLLFIGLADLHAQLSMSFEGIATALDCGNNSCLYTDPDSASEEHFLRNDNGIPVGIEGSGSNLGFSTEFTPSRSGTSGADGLSDGDIFGVAGTNQILSEFGIEPPEGAQAFLMEDTDGQVSIYFEHVDLKETIAPELNFHYILSDTSWESSSGQNDRFYVRVEIDNCTSSTTLSVLDSDGGGTGGNSGGDIDDLDIEGIWNMLSVDLTAYTGCRAQLIIEFDSNSSAEALGIDHIVFTEGSREESTIGDQVPVPDLIGLNQETAIMAIMEAGLSIGTISSVLSAEVESGLVVDQDPPANTMLEPGSEVSFVVSSGKEDITPPEITCPEDIYATVEQGGCGITITFEVTATDDKGVVEIITSVPSGSQFGIGTTEVTATATDNAGNTSSCSFDVTVEQATTDELRIDGFVLVDADTNRDLMDIINGNIIDIASLPTSKLNIRARASDGVEKVHFVLSGPQMYERTEKIRPFAVFGDYSGDYISNVFPLGSYRLTATTYSGNDLSTGQGPSFMISFDFIHTTDIAISGFVLVNPETDLDLMPLSDGSVVELSTSPGSKLNIRANATRDVQSVALELTGTIDMRRRENEVPYALFGDIEGDYHTGYLPKGSYALTATPYSGNNLSGLAGSPQTINFTVIEGEEGLPLKLFPNPAVTGIKVAAEGVKKGMETYSIHVHDMQGRLVRKLESADLSNGTPIEIPTLTLPAGIYYMTLYGNQGTVERRTFVVDK